MDIAIDGIPSLAPDRRMRRNRRRGQVGMMDRGLASLIGVVAVLSVVSVYFLLNSDASADSQVDQINTIAQQVARLYGNQSNLYSTVSEKVVAQSGAVPANWTDQNQQSLYSVYHSLITLTGATNPVTSVPNGAWQLKLANVPEPACAVLGTTAFAPQMLGTTIGGAQTGTTTTPVGDAKDVTAACKGALQNGTVSNITFTFG